MIHSINRRALDRTKARQQRAARDISRNAAIIKLARKGLPIPVIMAETGAGASHVWRIGGEYLRDH